MSDLINESVIKRRLEIFLEFIDYFNLEGALGIAEFLDENDLTLARTLWTIDDHFVLDSVESYCNL